MESKYEGICESPFYSIEVRSDGKVNLCSPAFIKYEDCYIGNIFEQDFSEIWNCLKAREFRRLAMQHNHPYCNRHKCAMLYNVHTKPDIDVSGGFSEFIPTYPTHVVFSHDPQCNVRCIFCRDNHIHNTAEQVKEMDSKIESHYLPLCRDAKIVKMQGAGEIFASRHSRNLIKAIAGRYPDIQFHLQSNGTLFDKENCDELGITDRLYKAVICAHAVTKATYDKLVLDGSFDKVMKNIEWLGSLKKAGKLKYFYLGFVVSAINYREMKDYVLLARQHGAEAYFVELRIENEPTHREEKKLAITDKRHPEYNRLCRMLKDPVFSSPGCHLDLVFKTMRPVSFFIRMKDRISPLSGRNRASIGGK
jgi:MoaA/NifB/PqqE/SkfB family radical SAM enzyme